MRLARMILALAFVGVAVLFAYPAIKMGFSDLASGPDRFLMLPALGFLGAAWAVWPGD
jgi:hypothetical protein